MKVSPSSVRNKFHQQCGKVRDVWGKQGDPDLRTCWESPTHCETVKLTIAELLLFGVGVGPWVILFWGNDLSSGPRPKVRVVFPAHLFFAHATSKIGWSVLPTTGCCYLLLLLHWRTVNAILLDMASSYYCRKVHEGDNYDVRRVGLCETPLSWVCLLSSRRIQYVCRRRKKWRYQQSCTNNHCSNSQYLLLLQYSKL